MNKKKRYTHLEKKKVRMEGGGERKTMLTRGYADRPSKDTNQRNSLAGTTFPCNPAISDK